MLHPLVVAVPIPVKLGEHQIPELDIAVTVAADTAGRFAAAVFLTSVKIDLRAGAAGAGTNLPEIIIFSETDNMSWVYADLFGPDFNRFVVVLIDRNPQPVHRKFEHLGDKLPSPRGCLMLEIIPEREVSEHFKIGAMTCGFSHIFNIRGTDALLAGGDPLSGWGFDTKEPFFHGGHARVDQ